MMSSQDLEVQEYRVVCELNETTCKMYTNRRLTLAKYYLFLKDEIMK